MTVEVITQASSASPLSGRELLRVGDLVMTDLGVPGLGGHELAAQPGEHFPGMHVLFPSGYTEDSAVGRGLMELGNISGTALPGCGVIEPSRRGASQAVSPI